jgi:hypothetical protein
MHFRWRFDQSPFASQIACYVASSRGEVRQALLTRSIVVRSRRITRILDIFGDLSDGILLQQLISSAMADARDEGSVQVTAVSFRPCVKRALWRGGFVLSSPMRFCWTSMDQSVMNALRQSELDWSLADSDNDEVD